jgi:hypothetical protein
MMKVKNEAAGFIIKITTRCAQIISTKVIWNMIDLI